MKKLELIRTGATDDWDRPIYTDTNNNIYVDINMNDENPHIHTVTPNYGEPDYPISNFIIINK